MAEGYLNILLPSALIFAIFSILVRANDLNSCTGVKMEYKRHNFQDDVPDHPLPGNHLKVCTGKNGSVEATCCTVTMERRLSVQSRQTFDNSLKGLLNPFSLLLEKKQKKFDDFFLDLINHSRRSFNEMFEQTYGQLYTNNAYVFTDLYQALEDYYLHGKKDMQEIMDNFFQKLYQRMYQVLNSQYLFNDAFMKCVQTQMESLQPFGDIPKKLTISVKRSFVAFRTFVQALSTAASVVKNVLKINPSMNCVHELMKMTHCSTCAGHLGVKPCMPYCLHVQQLCLADHRPLVIEWRNFVVAMEKLGNRLEGPFNIGNEIGPIDYQISYAIMNFQESGAEISQRISDVCGKLPYNTTNSLVKRNAKELKLEVLNFDAKRGHYVKDDKNLSPAEAIRKLVREIKTKVKNSKDFWSELPSGMCKEARHHGASNCWTGVELGKYSGLPLLNLSKSATNPEMDEQIFRLKLIASKLKEAHLGRDVSWIDDEWLGNQSSRKQEPQYDEGYEGSGSGYTYSSRHEVTASQYPPDDEDGYSETGSGYYPPEDRVVDYDTDTNEGSGDDKQSPPRWRPEPTDKSRSGHGVYDFVPEPQPPQRPPSTPSKENPSTSPAGKPMSLSFAIAVYLLPALFNFLTNSVG